MCNVVHTQTRVKWSKFLWKKSTACYRKRVSLILNTSRRIYLDSATAFDSISIRNLIAFQ
ncbi:hypothetical protein PilKf_00050 [Pillotina sp. SPG140]|jgi:hypothetical protein